MQSCSPERETVERLAEEFVERYRRGEHPPLTEYTERYPEHAEQIRDLFPALVMMEQIAPDSGSDSSSPPTSLGQQTNVQPKQIGDYRILREIGRGGMGIVYEAEQVSLGRHVALKVLPQQFVPNSKQRQRFEREARSAAKLHHTNIVPVFGVGEENGLHYYVMQYIHGLGLDAVLDELRRFRRDKQSSPPGDGEIRVARPIGQEARRDENGVLPPKDVSVEEVARSFLTGFVERPGMAAGDQGEQAASPPAPVPAGNGSQKALSASSVVLPGQSGDGRKSGQSYWHSVAHVGVQVAGALAYAHQQGVLHRDIKPANLLLDTQGTVWVTDFGLAKVEDQHNLTHTGDMVGTLRYMAPEVFNGKADARSEVYALGLTLYEMLALWPAFDEKDRHQLVKQVITAEPSRLDKLNRAIPRDLVTIVHKAIDRDPEHRYQNARELAEDLEHFLAGEPVRARPAGLSERALKWARRRPAVAALLGVIALSLVSLLGGTLWHNAQLGAANIQLNDALLISEKRRLDADTNLYHSLVGEARALRRARDNGYRGEVFKRLAHALQLRTPDNDPLDLRQEAAACLGDFVGFDPVIWEDTSSFQHPQFVRGDLPYSIAFSPDSHVLAIDVWQLGLVRLWNVYTSRETAALRWQGTKLEKPSRDSRSWHGPRVLKAMEFSKDGKIFVAATGHSVHLWNLAGASEKLVLTGHAGGVPDVVFSPDGKLLASAGKDHTIKIWDPVTGTLLKTLTEFSTPVQTLSFSPDGRILAAGDFEKDTVRLYDVPSWKELAVMHPQVGSIVASVGFSPDGKYFAAAGWTGLTLWRIVPGKTDQSGESKFTFQHHGRLAESPSVSVCFSADSNWLAWLSWDEAEDKIRYGQIHFTDLRSPQPRPLSAAGSWNGVLALGFYPDCRHLVFVSDKRAIIVWDVSSNREAFSFGKEELEGLSTKPVARLSADGAWYAMGSQTVTIWDMRTRKLLLALPEERSAVCSVGWSPNRELLAVGTFGGGPIIWNLPKVKAKLGEIGLGW